MKKITALVSILLCVCLLAGCAGTPVIYHKNCDCPTDGVNTPVADNTKPEIERPVAEGALKTGIALVAGAADSFDATADKNGEGKYDVTMVAVLVDDNGVIYDCILDGVSTSVKFDTAGQITSDLAVAPMTKNELGENYGMVAYGGAIAEWDKQAAALAEFACGKTVDELKNGAIDETGKAPVGSDLASSATIYLGSYVSAIEKAVMNAAHLGADGGDTLRLAAISSISGSTSATEEKAGTTQLEVTMTATTMKDGVITSCAIDSVQAKVGFDMGGAITTDTTSPIKTKNELGSDYGMVAWGGAIAEWDAQAASFAAYVTGKTPEEVAGIAVNEKNAPADADLASSVTIGIGDFLTLVEKAAL